MHTDTHIIRDGAYPLPLKLLLKLRKIFARFSRPQLNKIMQEKLKDCNFTIFCNNCLGGYFYHDAGREFTTPTINLALDGPDFIRFLERPAYYLSKEIEFLDLDPEAFPFPVGLIEDVEIRFVHYKSNQEAQEIWDRRKARIVWDNIFIVATDHEGMYLPEMLERFDKLPYKNKVLFTAKSYPQYEWAVQVKQFKHRNNVRIMSAFANFKGQRYYETCFDIANWIQNNSTNKNKTTD